MKDNPEEMSEGVRKLSSCMVETGTFTSELFFPGKNTLYGTGFTFLVSSKSYMSECSLSLLYNIVLIN